MKLAGIVLIAVACVLNAQAPSQRQQLLDKMKADPASPWPPMKGHAVLALPGTRMDQKGYHEPGAWFSPAPGSFGLTVLPQGNTKQRLDNLAIVTEAPLWSARWEVTGACAYRLTLDSKSEDVRLRIQSAGPAGGPLRSVVPRDGGLDINGEWRLTPATVDAEGSVDWLFAEIPAPSRRIFTLEKLTPCVEPPYRMVFLPEMDLPDARFTDSLRAQTAHLLMGLVGNQVRPGETVNYPLAWLRDGAYSVVALATAGQLTIARTLATYFAENDFFGGFGPEADAPGLSIWAIEGTAARLKDESFDKEMWPNVYRKAQYILRLMRTESEVREIPVGPIVPKHRQDPNLNLVAEPAKDGLIIGRMDHHRPLLYVNAVDYLGLISAAQMATRLGHPDDASRWRIAAGELREAWWRAFDTKERENERAAIAGLWPSWIAADSPTRYRTALQAQWDKRRTPEGGFKDTPEWTYFDIAQAHNWLYAGDPRKTWQTLEWFWANQASPGLYTWWEGSGEENSFGLWEQIRGWATPPNVTPHYWTAAEMLSLQFAMLAYVDPNGELVVGEGVPQSWTRDNLTVRGLYTPLGRVDWSWKDGKISVTADGKPVKYRLGAALRNPSRSLREPAR